MNKTNDIAIVSGLNGFLGQHLRDALLKRDIDVIGIPHALLYDYDTLKDYIKPYNPTYIFHLAAYGNHGMQTEEERIVVSNYIGTWNLLRATKDIAYKAFINIATSSMYGHKGEPMKEEDSFKSDTFYAATKAGALYLARAYAKQYNKPIVSIIPFSIFGEGEADWRFIPTACRNLIERKPMPFVTSSTHDWVYVKEFIASLLFITSAIKEIKGEWINIGTGNISTNLQIVQKLEDISGKTLIREETYKEPPHHSGVWVADTTKLTQLGWKPKYSLLEGLGRTWKYYKEKYEPVVL